MDIQQARRIIRNTFEGSFNKVKFIDFIKDLFNQYDESKAFHLRGCYIPKAFENIVKSYERIGTYTDSEGKKIDLLIVYLKKETTIDRARTAQRNFIANYLKGRGEKDAGLVAFVSPEEDDWRFSFVKMEYKFEKTPKGDVKVKEEFTAARRYSFLVGKNESSHTAQSCFIDILKNDEYNPTIYELEEAFNIEKVTKEFFEKYRDLFLQIKDSLDEVVRKDEEIRKEFQEKGINTVDFSKKLLGQIVFLYFLQKKGWFGVPRGKGWGEGDKKFLRNLFDIAKKENRNYFNKFLEPLFYEALRLERPKDYYAQFSCRIPFLNGGLFDPLNDYDWQDTDIEIPNEIFSNNHKTKEGDTGDGILDIFDRYNFTVKEDEPLEKEVAIDPEMLGKVFENLLEVKDRKSKGTYYTPREIVHYMCQQSLINYLYAEVNSKQECRTKKEKIQMKLLGTPDPIQQNLIVEQDSNNISKEDLEKLIKYGDTTIENDNHVATKGEETKTYSFKLPENIRKNAEIIDEALKNIRVCDPAIGSGAFPVGMMNEIIRARNTLTSYLSLQEEEATKQSRTIYDFKRHAIQNCLYGVDIDPGAVEIAKLRLWLSLIVDEEDINKIKPLPNLDYKIMQGNSLISEFMGIDLDNDKQNNENAKLFSTDETKELHVILKAKKDELLNQPNTNKKKVLRREIEDLIINIFEIKLQKQKSDYFEEAREIEEKYARHPVKEQREKEINREKNILSRRTGFNLEEIEKQLRQYTSNQKIRPFFPWKLYFSEVFQGEDGFDVVIANPPYGIVFEENLKRQIGKFYSSFSRNNDIYVAFYEQGINLLKFKGSLVYISPNTFLNGDYFKIFRKTLIQKTIIFEIYDFKELSIFEDPTVYVCTLSCMRDAEKKLPYEFHLKIAKEGTDKYDLSIVRIDSITGASFKPINLIFSNILALKNVEIMDNLFYIKDVGFNYWTKGKGKKRDGKSIGDRVFYEGEYKNKKDIPFLKGKDIFKYGNLTSHNYLRYNYNEFLNKTVDTLRFSSNFLKINPKIIYRQTANKIIATLDTNGNFLDKTIHLIVHKAHSKQIDLRYILALLNSKLFEYLYAYISQERKDRIFAQVKTTYIKQLPIRTITAEQTPFIFLIDKILSITKDEDYLENKDKKIKVKEYERQIDEIVYKLYNLTPEEIEIVEGFKNK